MSPPANIKKSNSSKIKQSKNVRKEQYINLNGVAGSIMGEHEYKFFRLQNERVISNKNAYIVLGRDRAGSPLNGYGNKAHAKASSIDIVVGRNSCALDEASLKKQALWCNPDFKNDAARIYISQKTDIDKNFALPKGEVGYSTEGSIVRSGIGIKADSVRMIARSGIKLVASAESRTSMGVNDDMKKGIDLIAGLPWDKDNPNANSLYNLDRYRHGMQQIPKGQNLVDAFTELLFHMDKITGILLTFIIRQMKYNNQVATHTHISPFFGIPIPPSPELPGLTLQNNLETKDITIQDLENYKLVDIPDFFDQFLTEGDKRYINSIFHYLN